jgi:hypothetical protein
VKPNRVFLPCRFHRVVRWFALDWPRPPRRGRAMTTHRVNRHGDFNVPGPVVYCQRLWYTAGCHSLCAGAGSMPVLGLLFRLSLLRLTPGLSPGIRW